MVKIKHNDWAGRTINLPIVGKLDFDDKGEAKVKDVETAEKLASLEGLGIELSGKVKAPAAAGSENKGKSVSQMNATELIAKVVEMGRDYEDMTDKKKAELKTIIGMTDEEFTAAHPSEGKEGDEDNVGGEDDEKEGLSKEEKIDYINSLEKMDELKELASAFPEGEWNTIKSKAKLAEYLIEQVEKTEEEVKA